MTADLVPVDNMAAVEALDPEARVLAVTHMLGEARAWLAHAMETSEPQAIATFKAQMATVAEATKQLGLSKEIQMDAQEMVRRAEQGLGQSVRKGQADDVIAPSTPRDIISRGKPSTTDYLSPGREMADIYAMTDGVSDDDFDEAIAEAKSEGNLSRANVVRKLRPSPTAPRRRPLTEGFRDATLDLAKIVTRIETLTGDDRLPKNRDEVARYANDLIRARNALQRAIDQLST